MMILLGNVAVTLCFAVQCFLVSVSFGQQHLLNSAENNNGKLEEIISRNGEYTDLNIYEDTNPHELALLSCADSLFEACYDLTKAAIQVEKNRVFGYLLVNWTYSDMCGCYMPPRQKKDMLQNLHIPKTGTSFNFILHDYFDCPNNNSDPHNGCAKWLDNPTDLMKGLCGGKLYSCQGHRTPSNLPQLVLHQRTNLLTMMRDPWKRGISDYNYILSTPHAKHLSPEQNLTALFPTNPYSFLMAPGISNCATKMLNGFQCGELVDITSNHVDIAKKVLSKIFFFGLTELFKESLCLFTWLHGGQVKPEHLKQTRRSSYQTSTNIDEVLTADQKEMFSHRYRHDIELYRYAKELFSNRYTMTGCLPFSTLSS